MEDAKKPKAKLKNNILHFKISDYYFNKLNELKEKKGLSISELFQSLLDKE